MSVRDLKLSTFAFKAASVSPQFTAMTMKLVAPRLPSNWVINEIARRHNLRICVSAKLTNGMSIWTWLADEVGEGIRRRGYTELETLQTIIFSLTLALTLGSTRLWRHLCVVPFTVLSPFPPSSNFCSATFKSMGSQMSSQVNAQCLIAAAKSGYMKAT